ncbi:hypothetical protein [Kocuria sabuli]|uniref:hypothetical protein n=1 Tax=Kocuria sabuli TaxID=3071448 RepID=UPI0034D4DC1D
MFTTSPNRFAQNWENSETITASPARLTTDTGEHLPGVALFTRGRVTSVITAEAAHRVALEIVEALEAHTPVKPVRRDAGVNDAFADLADR